MASEQLVREVIIDDIVDRELKMFLAVRTPSPSQCKENPETFRQMRRAAHIVLSTDTLKFYHKDLLDAGNDGEGRNLVELKYARMDNLVPCLNISTTIDKIVDIEGRWLQELSVRYPRIFKDASGLKARFYRRSELETYSDRTLESYYTDVLKAAEEGRNLAAQRYTALFQQMGHASIEDMEEHMQRQAA